MSLVYVFTASAMEARPVERLMDSPRPVEDSVLAGKCGSQDVLLFDTGMGQERARYWAGRALSGCCGSRPGAVLVAGLCGGLTPSLESGAVVLYETCLSEERAPVSSDPALVDRLGRALADSGIAFRRVTGISTLKVAATPSGKQNLARSGACVVDMETYEVLRACREAGVAAAALRSVSDECGQAIPDFDRAMTAAGRLDPLKLALVCASSPRATIRLSASSKRAMKSLDLALKACFNPDPAAAAGIWEEADESEERSFSGVIEE